MEQVEKGKAYALEEAKRSGRAHIFQSRCIDLTEARILCHVPQSQIVVPDQLKVPGWKRQLSLR